MENSPLFKPVISKLAPEALGPYSQAVAMLQPQRLVFISGQLPIDVETGKLANEDIASMTRRILISIEALLKEAGSDLEHVIRVEIFCTSLKEDFGAINAEYTKFFTGAVKPARQTVQVAALPLGSPIEISCIGIIH